MSKKSLRAAGARDDFKFQIEAFGFVGDESRKLNLTFAIGNL